MNRNTDIDFARCILILEVVLIHIVNFGELYPEAKAVILSFLAFFGRDFIYFVV
jgi:fucose 4-O-acetylase-like acetyltransferase